jgi:hypothetical protein
MKAKLKKDINGEYFLEGFIKDIPRQINVYQQISETKARFGFGEHTGKLSKQKCDEIFGIVNVEELAQEVCDDTISSPYHCYIAGFNKNAELNKDKLFTLEQLEIAFKSNPNNFSGFGLPFYKFLDTIQQPTEIEVDIVMEKVKDENKIIGSAKGVKGSGHKITTYKSVPKLDVNGCLILKRK